MSDPDETYGEAADRILDYIAPNGVLIERRKALDVIAMELSDISILTRAIMERERTPCPKP